MASRALCSSAPPNGVVCGGVWCDVFVFTVLIKSHITFVKA